MRRGHGIVAVELRQWWENGGARVMATGAATRRGQSVLGPAVGWHRSRIGWASARLRGRGVGSVGMLVGMLVPLFSLVHVDHPLPAKPSAVRALTVRLRSLLRR